MSEGEERPKTYSPRSSCLLTELDDGTGVVLDLETKFYHSLNTTAVAVWRALSSEPRSLRQLSQCLIDEFEVEEAEASADVQSLLEELLAQGLIAESPADRR